MNFDAIFKAYYTLYRTEADTPNSADDEYTVALSLANEAVNRWANYDDTYWKELFTTLQTEQDGDLVIATGTTSYATPANMKEAGGFVRVLNSDGATVRRYTIIEPQDAQFKQDQATYCYFTGDPNNGFTLHLNPAPDSSINGFSMDYIYYKKPTEFDTGTDVCEINQPYFLVHRMLGNRFRGSRNPYYDSAIRDAEDVLKTMQLNNNSGNWADPWKLADNSGSAFGSE